MVTFTEISSETNIPIDFTLSLTAEERTRSRYRFETEEGQVVFFRLPRGTILKDGDLLQSSTGEVLLIRAKPETVFTVTAKDTLSLLRAAYHLGNRHVALEVTASYLRLSPDKVLQTMLEQLGVNVKEEVAPFSPEMGAYKQLTVNSKQ